MSPAPIEPARLDDAEGIALLLAACMPDAWSADMVTESLLTGGDAFVVRGAPGGGLAGVAITRVSADEAEILQIAVDPALRRAGLGRRLLVDAVADCIRRGAHAVFLEVRARNVAARALYAAAGFEPIATRPRYYRNGDDAIVMRKDSAFPPPPG